MAIISIGEKAPAFNLPVIGDSHAEGAHVALNELKGQRVILIFYPKNATPG